MASAAVNRRCSPRPLIWESISPLGHQPMIDPATGDAIVFNGEIYNFRKLRRKLEASGHAFRSTGDTEVLLRALTAWGERGVGAASLWTYAIG